MKITGISVTDNGSVWLMNLGLTTPKQIDLEPEDIARIVSLARETLGEALASGTASASAEASVTTSRRSAQPSENSKPSPEPAAETAANPPASVSRRRGRGNPAAPPTETAGPAAGATPAPVSYRRRTGTTAVAPTDAAKAGASVVVATEPASATPSRRHTTPTRMMPSITDPDLLKAASMAAPKIGPKAVKAIIEGFDVSHVSEIDAASRQAFLDALKKACA